MKIKIVCTKKSVINTISGYAGLSANAYPRSNFAFRLGKGQDENETIHIFIWKNVSSLLYAQLNTKILHKEKVLPYSYGQLNDLVSSVPPLNH